MRLSLIRAALVCLALALFAGDLFACGREDRQSRREQRREARGGAAHSSCTGAAPQAAPPSHRPAPTYSAPATAVASCPNGKCPLPR